MADEWIEFEIIGTRDLLWNLLTSDRKRRQYIRRLLVDTADNATGAQRIYAARLTESGYMLRHLHQTSLRWRPGGAGGGGHYEIVTGVRRGTSNHPLHVHFGTKNKNFAGRFNIVKASLVGGIGGRQGRIYPRDDRARASVISTGRDRKGGDANQGVRRPPALTFQKKGEPRKFRAWVSGQKAQPFVYWAFRNANIYAQGRVRASSVENFI